jgi:hypothetical protein
MIQHLLLHRSRFYGCGDRPSQINCQSDSGIIYYRLEAFASQNCGEVEILRFLLEIIRSKALF